MATDWRSIARTRRAGFGALVLIGFALWLTNRSLVISHPPVTFVVTLLLLMAAMAFIGVAINGRPDGVFIDDRNRISLSKFQISLWTVLVVAGLVCVAAHNLSLPDDPAPLDLTIPTALLSALGISAGSFVASPVLLSLKARLLPQQGAATATTEQIGGTPAFVGKVVGRTDPKDAEWMDMLVGEEVGNFSSPDLGKIQQLFISVLLVGIYAIAVLHALQTNGGKIGAMPELNQNFVWLMGVSHASYLAYKAAPHTETGDSTTGQASDTPQPGAQGVDAGRRAAKPPVPDRAVESRPVSQPALGHE